MAARKSTNRYLDKQLICSHYLVVATTMIRKGAGQVGWLGIAALLATAARKGDSATECTGGWDCGEVPAAVDVGQCAVETRKPCSLLTQLDLESLRNAEGDMSTAVLFEGCDELPEFARFTRALEKQRLVDVYGSIKTRLAENIAGVWYVSHNHVFSLLACVCRGDF